MQEEVIRGICTASLLFTEIFGAMPCGIERILDSDDDVCSSVHDIEQGVSYRPFKSSAKRRYVPHESVIEKKNDSYLASPLDGRSPFEVKSNTLVSMNMMGFSPKLFKYLEEGLVDFFKQNKSNLEKCEYLIPDVVEKLTLDGTFTTKIIHTNAVWLGMTYKEDKEMLVREIEKLVRNNTYPIHLTDYEKI